MQSLRYDWQFPEDLGIAVEWYANRSPPLADRFRESIRKCLDSIEKFPESYPLLINSQRCAMVRGFPWMIVFAEEHDVTVIVRLIHTASNWTI